MGCTNNALAFFAISARNAKNNVQTVSIPNAHRLVMVSQGLLQCLSLINAHHHFT